MNSNDIRNQMHQQARAQIKNAQQPIQPDQPQEEPMPLELKIAMWILVCSQYLRQSPERLRRWLTPTPITGILLVLLTVLLLGQQHRLNTLSRQQAQLQQINSQLIGQVNQQDANIKEICAWLRKHVPVNPHQSPLDSPD